MISLIVLAAGKSTRMKQNKLLLNINGEAMIQRVVKSARTSNTDELVVVLGYEAEKIKEQLSEIDCKFVTNENYVKAKARA
jgi:molybdenum cofactor cytidylyltransferase